MQTKIATAGVVILVLAATLESQAAPAELAEYSVAELLEPCMEGDNDSRWGAAAEAECEQYIKGFTDAYLLLNEAERNGVCLPPEGNRADEVRWAFMKWAHQNYEKRRMPAASGLMETIKEVFTCQ